MNSLKALSPYVLSLMRIVAGLVFLQHGTSKFLGFPHTQYSGTALMSMNGAAGVVELVCGALIVVGFLTRPAAFLASGTMAVAYFMVHAPQSFFPLVNGGDQAILFCFVFFYLVFAGAGPISVDRLRGAA